MKVLVLGATGFIGHPVANALVRAGHHVYGSTRDAAKAKTVLQANEIIPVVCDSTTAEGRKVWAALLDTIDVVIDTVPASTPEVPLATFAAVTSAARREPGQRVTYIYTGGSWVHARGPGGLDAWSSETQPHTGHVKATAWRWAVEKEVLASDKVNGIVIRPSMLYGRSGSIFSHFIFGPAAKAAKDGTPLELVAEKDSRFLTIHQDDLADLYLRVVEQGSLLKGQAIVGANPATERLIDIIDAAVRAAGVQTYTIRAPSDPFETAWASTTNLKPTLGLALTGWVPRKLSVVDGMDLYWAAFAASSESA